MEGGGGGGVDPPSHISFLLGGCSIQRKAETRVH